MLGHWSRGGLRLLRRGEALLYLNVAWSVCETIALCTAGVVEDLSRWLALSMGGIASITNGTGFEGFWNRGRKIRRDRTGIGPILIPRRLVGLVAHTHATVQSATACSLVVAAHQTLGRTWPGTAREPVSVGCGCDALASGTRRQDTGTRYGGSRQGGRRR